MAKASIRERAQQKGRELYAHLRNDPSSAELEDLAVANARMRQALGWMKLNHPFLCSTMGKCEGCDHESGALLEIIEFGLGERDDPDGVFEGDCE